MSKKRSTAKSRDSGLTESRQPADSRSSLPSVAVLLEEPVAQELIARHSRPLVLDAIRETLDRLRSELQPEDQAPSPEATARQVGDLLLLKEADRMRPVVNATGVILHTGLGRAVLPQQAADALAKMNRCCNMQVDLSTGLRGKRSDGVRRLLCQLTGAEDAMVVNNNAAATLLILTALSQGREVIVSRGQLVEIGGSFRLPDCIRQSGAIMVEVGTTNKTHLRDYEQALSERTAMILRVNPSNYRIIGFHKEVPIGELAALKEKQPVVVVDDLGCGALIDLAQFGLPHEPTVQESIAAGADLACFSGDKLISGPQAGIIVGKRELIAKIKKHPLTRMMRICKLTDAALEHTLRLFLQPETLLERNPTLRMIAQPIEPLRKRAQALKRRIDKDRLPLSVRVLEGESATGGGSLPDAPLPTFLLALTADSLPAGELNDRLRGHEPPIVARVQNDEVLLDTRTLLDGDDGIIHQALRQVVPR